MQTYDKDDLITLTATWLVNGSPTDPTTVTLTVLDPAGATTSYTYGAAQLIKDSTGVYHKDLNVTLTGHYRYKFIGTGTAQGVQQGEFYAEDWLATGTSDLCTVRDVREALETPPTQATARDGWISFLISEASAHINRHCDREFVPATTSATRRFPVYLTPLGRAPGWPVVRFSPYDLRTATTVTLHPEAASPSVLSSSQYTLEPVQPRDGVYSRLRLDPRLSLISNYSITFGHAQLDIAGAWGFATVPPEVRSACVRTVTSWMNKQAQTIGVGTGENQQVFQAGSVTYALPMVAKNLLEPFRRLV